MFDVEEPKQNIIHTIHSLFLIISQPITDERIKSILDDYLLRLMISLEFQSRKLISLLLQAMF